MRAVSASRIETMMTTGPPPTSRRDGYFLTAFYTGMRAGELLAIAWADVDGETLEVSKARVQGQITTTKTDEPRFVRIPTTVAKVIAALPSRFKKALRCSSISMAVPISRGIT